MFCDATGVNFEGGKIIRHALASKQCVAYANVQIAMDAPFQGQVATEKVRSQGRSETQFVGYSEENLKSQLTNIFAYVAKKYSHKLIVQVARGRSAEAMQSQLLEPILNQLQLCNRNIFYGYRQEQYFPYPDCEFVFVNIGMFARLNRASFIKPGQVCNPTQTYDIFPEGDGTLIRTNHHHYNDEKNILNCIQGLPPILLYGINDEMPFVTPENYKEEDFLF